MAQHDYELENQSAPNFRTDLNNVLSAVASQNSGASAPSTTFANMLWYDTTNDILKMRNEADSAWIDLFSLDQSADTAVPSKVTIASQAEAEAGTENTKAMSALRVKQAIDAGKMDFITSSSTITSGTILITGLGNYSELIVFGDSLSCSVTALRGIQLSSDGGSNWYNTYTLGASPSLTYQSAFMTYDNSSAAMDGVAEVKGFNTTWNQKFIIGANGGLHHMMAKTTSSFNAIRVISCNSTGTQTGLITSGTVYVYGR